MEETERTAAVAVEQSDGKWVVRVTVDGETTVQEFGTADEAEDFAHAQRTRFGITPQPDLA